MRSGGHQAFEMAAALNLSRIKKIDYLKVLVEEIHSTVVATIEKNGHPVTRCIDMMLYDESTVYFLTAKGKNFYEELMSQKYASLSAVKDKRCISLAGTVQNIGKEKLDEIFEKSVYMQKIYPGNTREALEVFKFTDGLGNFFDISDPSHVTRGLFSLGKSDSDSQRVNSGYFVQKLSCIGCKKCLSVCPQKCIDFSTEGKAKIDQNRCLHCGRCFAACPVKAIEKAG